MRIGDPVCHGQVHTPLVGAILIAVLLYSCTRDSEEVSIIPPPTNPLSRSVIGYGVISVSYIHVVDGPNQGGLSLGYLRKGAIVRVLERRSVNTESWVLVEGKYRGWLREGVVDIYDLEVQAETASDIMTQ